MSSSPPLIVTPFPFIRPTLPTELIEEILEQPSLSKADLASCCLVSRQFLNPARRPLYSTITIDHTTRTTGGRFKSTLTERSLLLVRSLRSSSTLRGVVISLCCERSFRREGEEHVSTDHANSAMEVTELIKDVLDSLPRVNRLYLRHLSCLPLQNYARSLGQKWTHLELLEADVDRNFVAHSPFPNLERLVCGGPFTEDDRRQFFLPPRLTHLELRSWEPSPFSIPNAASSPLQFLRILSIDLVNLPDLSKLPRLQHLKVVDFEDGNAFIRRVAESISHYRSLTSLTLLGFNLADDEDLCLHLCKRLPDSLIYLNLLSVIPLNSLVTVVERETLTSIRTLGLSDDCLCKDQEDDLERLRGTCERKGIELVKGEQDISIFGELSLISQPRRKRVVQIRVCYNY